MSDKSGKMEEAAEAMNGEMACQMASCEPISTPYEEARVVNQPYQGTKKKETGIKSLSKEIG